MYVCVTVASCSVVWPFATFLSSMCMGQLKQADSPQTSVAYISLHMRAYNYCPISISTLKTMACQSIPGSPSLKIVCMEEEPGDTVPCNHVSVPVYMSPLYMHKLYVNVYSRTSEQRTLWERVFCPLFGGCPYLGGSPYFDIIIISTMFKLLWMNKITFMLSVSE